MNVPQPSTAQPAQKKAAVPPSTEQRASNQQEKKKEKPPNSKSPYREFMPALPAPRRTSPASDPGRPDWQSRAAPQDMKPRSETTRPAAQRSPLAHRHHHHHHMPRTESSVYMRGWMIDYQRAVSCLQDPLIVAQERSRRKRAEPKKTSCFMVSRYLSSPCNNLVMHKCRVPSIQT
jgi:hypothetical protein